MTPLRRTERERGSCGQSSVATAVLSPGQFPHYDPQSARVAELVRRDRLKPDCPAGRVGSSPTPGMADLNVRLQPRSRRDEVAGERGGALVVRVTAPPVDGRANAALCAFVAKATGVAPSRVSVVRGKTSRDKVVRVEGVSEG